MVKSIKKMALFITFEVGEVVYRGIKRGEAPLINYLPSPLFKGRGIKGEGLLNN